MSILLEAWFIEIVKGIGRVLLNPLLYWAILLVFLAGKKRIRRERMDFGIKIFDMFSEWKGTWLYSILLGLIVSAITIGLGVVFSYTTILLFCIITILVSITGRFTLLSASYTLGISYFVLLFLPTVMEKQKVVSTELFSTINYQGLVILIGIFLVAESILLLKARKGKTYPELVQGSRGGWMGQHHIKKLAVIPFFILIPTGLITSFAPYWPYFTIGEQSFSLILIPFIIGFDHIVRGNDPMVSAGKLAKSMMILSFLVLLTAWGSSYYSWLSLAGVIVGIAGREYLNYRHRTKDHERSGFFQPTDKGLKVLSVIPNSPADRLDILAGESIARVNGNKVVSITEFYEALQKSGAFFKLEIIDRAGEKRFLQGALYEGDHHELGIIFTSSPHRRIKQNKIGYGS